MCLFFLFCCCCCDCYIFASFIEPHTHGHNKLFASISELTVSCCAVDDFAESVNGCSKAKWKNSFRVIMCIVKFHLFQLWTILVVATHGSTFNYSHLVCDQMTTTAGIRADGESTAIGINRQYLVNHVSLILCHLNVKSIYVFFENALKSTIVENLLRDNRVCAPPIVTLIKLVANWFYFLLYYCLVLGKEPPGDLCGAKYVFTGNVCGFCWRLAIPIVAARREISVEDL